VGITVGEGVTKDGIGAARPAEIPSGHDDVFVTDTWIVAPVVNNDEVGRFSTKVRNRRMRIFVLTIDGNTNQQH
jgi:hypothetical protein